MEAMEEQRIQEELKIVPILAKYVREEPLTVLEEKAIEVWLGRSNSNKAFFEQLKNREHVALELLNFEASASTTSEELNKLHSLIDNNRPKSIWRYWVSAAAIIFAVSISVYLYRYFQSDSFVQNKTTTAAAGVDIEPGKDQATLSFSDGKTVNLEGKTLQTDNNGITYLDGKTIAESNIQYATLATPRKGQYKTILPDGTQVWLNAQSKLKYPTQFNGKERLVELEGEGYFEVTHNAAKPFIVKSGDQQLKVLGTKFNINSYDNEGAILTTLVSGSVELTNTQNTMPVKLKPGQQGKLLSLSSIFSVDNVDTEVFTAWTANEFQFQGTSIGELLRQLERWYDVDVDYSNLPRRKVNGTISREKKLSSVLYALEKITDLKFKVIGRRIEIKE